MSQRRLTRRQAWRVKKIQEERLARLEKATQRAERLAEHGEPGPEQAGLVIANHGANLRIEDASGRVLHAVPRQQLDLPVAGDRVAWRETHDGQGVVVALLPRRNRLARPDREGRMRPLAANIDRLLVVTAPRPAMSEALIDRYLAAAELLEIPAAVVLNKADLLDPEKLESYRRRLSVYTRLGYPVLYASTKAVGGLDALAADLAGHTSVLVGQSGVGKSSIIQHLLPDREIRIAALGGGGRGHGRHTTSTTTLYHLPSGGDLIDSPGVRQFHLWRVEPAQLMAGFRELRGLVGQCRFSNCRHRDEPGCAVLAALASGHVSAERLHSWQRILDDQARAARRSR